MAPKAKSSKEAEDQGSVAQVEAGLVKDANGEAEVNPEVEAGTGEGGLLAALKKNKNRRAKKGKLVDSPLEGEDPGAGDENGVSLNLNGKAPEEATLDDEDVFSGTMMKAKSGGKMSEKQAEGPAGGNKDDEGGLKSKKEKEKEKREREKLRKKEQVRQITAYVVLEC
jgi:translation initiation factor 5B